MRYKYGVSLSAVAVAMLTCHTAQAQLETIRMVPNTPDYTDAVGGGGSAIQFSGGDIAIVYKIQTDYSSNDEGPDRLYIIRSKDGGDTWSDPEEIDSSENHQGICCISTAVSSNNRAMISYFNDTGWKMLYSDDDGSSWSVVPNSPSLGNNGTIAEGRDGSFAATFGLSGQNRDIQSVRTSADGLIWSAASQAVSSDGVYICNANIVQTGETDYLLIYEECFFGTGEEVPIKQIFSGDGGATWSDPTDAVTSLSSFGARSDVAVSSDGTLWLLHTSDEDLYYTTSADGGASWAPSTQWTDNTGTGNNPGDFDQDFQPKLSFVDDNPFAVFLARRGNDWFHLFYGIPGVSRDPLLVTAVEQVSAEIPNAIRLGQNYPNPFNPSTTISFSLSDTGPASLVVYDLMGREQARLVDATLNAGTYEVTLDASSLATGSYIYRLISGGESSERMLTVLK